MSSLLIATVLSMTGPGSDGVNSFPGRAVTDRELARTHGGAVLSGARDGAVRVTQDATVRDFTIAQTVMTQQFDNWLNDVGTPLIAAELLR